MLDTNESQTANRPVSPLGLHETNKAQAAQQPGLR